MEHEVTSDVKKLLQRFVGWGSTSKLTQLVLTLVVYALYAAMLGASLAPATWLAIAAFRVLVLPALATGALPRVGAVLLFALALGGSLHVFFFWGLILTGTLVRLLSLGIAPGRYPAISPVTLLWMILNGIFTIAHRMSLPLVPMTFFSETFHRLCGMKLGRGAWINTFAIMDPYLVEIGEGTVVGGDGSTIGLRACLRKGRQVPPGSRISSLAGLDSRRIRALERGGDPEGRHRA